MHNGKVNKTRYNDSRKLTKQTSFTVKKLRGKPFRKAIHYSKEKFQIYKKLLSLNSTIRIDELTAETFYRFRTFELFNI